MARKKTNVKSAKKVEERTQKIKQQQQDIEQIKNDIIDNETFRRRISKAKDYLDNLRTKRLQELDDEKKKKRNRLLKEIGAWKFNINPNENIKVTIGDFVKTCTKFEYINEKLLTEQKLLSVKAVRDIEWPKYSAELRKLDIAKDKVELLRRSFMKVDEKENKFKARNILDRNITQLQCSAAILKKIIDEKNCAEQAKGGKDLDSSANIDEDRSAKANENSIEKTFEDYIDGRLQELKSEIRRLNGYIKQLNNQHTELLSIVDEKTKQVTYLKKQLKNIKSKDVKSSKAFQEILARKEWLCSELKNYEKLRNEIAKETSSTIGLLQENQRNLERQQNDCTTIENIISKFKSMYEEKLDENKKREKSCEKLQEEIADMTEEYYKRNDDNIGTTRQYEYVKKQYDDLLMRKANVENYKRSILGVLTKISQDTQKKYLEK